MPLAIILFPVGAVWETNQIVVRLYWFRKFQISLARFLHVNCEKMSLRMILSSEKSAFGADTGVCPYIYKISNIFGWNLG